MKKFCRNPEALWREEDIPKKEALDALEKGEDASGLGTSIILLHGDMHSLNILGTEIWKLCEGKTPDEIVQQLEKSFDVERDVLTADVNSFLASLIRLGLVYEE